MWAATAHMRCRQTSRPASTAERPSRGYGGGMGAESSIKPQCGDGRAHLIFWAVALSAVALAARLYELDDKPLWLDEVLTKQRSALAIPALVDDSVRNNHSPLFFLIEHAIAAAAPGAVGLRLLPAFAGALSAGLVFAVGRAVGLRTGAVLAGLFAALAPLQVAFGQEARSYTLMLVLTLVALWGLVQLATAPNRAVLAWSSSEGLRTAWLAYAFGTAGAALVLGDALLWWIVSNIAMLAAILPRTVLRRVFLLRWCIIQGMIFLVAAPVYLASLTAHKGNVLQGFLWIPPLTGRLIWANAATLYGLRGVTMVSMRLLPGPIPYLAPFVLALGAAGLVRLRHTRGPLTVLLIAAVGPPVILALLSLIHPMLLPRYLLLSAAPFFVIAGAAIETLPGVARPLALIGAACMLAVNLMPYYRAETKPRWDLAAAFLAARLRPHDAVMVTDEFSSLMLKTYLGGRMPPVIFPDAMARLADPGRIWAIYGPAGQGQLPSQSVFFSRAETFGIPNLRKRIGEDIIIEKIEPAGSEPTSATQ
jgi:mannosyltransferase